MLTFNQSIAIHHCDGNIIEQLFKQGLPWELLYTNDLVLAAESEGSYECS